MVWRNPYQAERERERARINQAAARELIRRHRDEYEAIRREMSAPAKGGTASAAPEGIGTQSPEAVVPSLGAATPTATSDLRASSPADPASHSPGARRGSHPESENPDARNAGALQNTTRS